MTPLNPVQGGRHGLRRLVGLSLLALATAFAACGEGVGGGPLRVDTEDDAGTVTVPPVDVPVLRTVSMRNPYGNVAVTDNLLWDGDFEFRPSFADQYGWLVATGAAVSFALPDLGTGSRCHSGIKCAVIPPGRRILGIAVGSKDRDLAVSFWARNDNGTCNGISAIFISANEVATPSERIEPVQAEPFEDGWCKFEALTPARSDSAYLVIGNESDSLIQVDDAVVQAVGPSSQQARSMRSATPLSAEEEQQIAGLRASARRARLPRRAPPTRGEQALAAHLKRLMR